MSVRDLVRSIQREMRDGAPEPLRVQDMLSTLTSLMGNCHDETRIADLDHKKDLLAALQEHGSGVKAKMQAETLPAYARKREAEDTSELVMEMVRSLRRIAESQVQEMRLTPR